MHGNKLANENFKLEIMKPMAELQERIDVVDDILRRKMYESDYEIAEKKLWRRMESKMAEF